MWTWAFRWNASNQWYQKAQSVWPSFRLRLGAHRSPDTICNVTETQWGRRVACLRGKHLDLRCPRLHHPCALAEVAGTRSHCENLTPNHTPPATTSISSRYCLILMFSLWFFFFLPFSGCDVRLQHVRGLYRWWAKQTISQRLVGENSQGSRSRTRNVHRKATTRTANRCLSMTTQNVAASQEKGNAWGGGGGASQFLIIFPLRGTNLVDHVTSCLCLLHRGPLEESYRRHTTQLRTWVKWRWGGGSSFKDGEDSCKQSGQWRHLGLQPLFFGRSMTWGGAQSLGLRAVLRGATCQHSGSQLDRFHIFDSANGVACSQWAACSLMESTWRTGSAWATIRPWSAVKQHTQARTKTSITTELRAAKLGHGGGAANRSSILLSKWHPTTGTLSVLPC